MSASSASTRGFEQLFHERDAPDSTITRIISSQNKTPAVEITVHKNTNKHWRPESSCHTSLLSTRHMKFYGERYSAVLNGQTTTRLRRSEGGCAPSDRRSSYSVIAILEHPQEKLHLRTASCNGLAEKESKFADHPPIDAHRDLGWIIYKAGGGPTFTLRRIYGLKRTSMV
ncbi:hypothetical protein SCHPADRAFT_470156 [Schizopora paradoxa]|uniref:Uncharacterized protein n=1 Tax=Schizopora paradoxa TaxID=27342 RepID=A0A0H2RIM0_9AGAM|nr:hypothetical protein SCHPADRAFT_470156 [Schizopora paradoxa]